MSKPLEWAIIKARYLKGESPSSIAEDYATKAKEIDKLTKSISNKAFRDKWKPAKEEIIESVEPAVRNEIKELKSQVLEEFKRIAFSDMRNIAKWGYSSVEFKDSEQISDDAAATVAEVSQTITESGGTIRVKTHSKISGLVGLAKILGMYEAKHQDNEEEPPGFIINAPDDKPAS